MCVGVAVGASVAATLALVAVVAIARTPRQANCNCMLAVGSACTHPSTTCCSRVPVGYTTRTRRLLHLHALLAVGWVGWYE